MTLHPPVPVADELSAPFWEGVRAGRLLLQKCSDCGQFQFPPVASCRRCSSADLPLEEVSGRGTVYSFTETMTGARHPFFQAASPYLVGEVELEEQAGLVFASNFPGSTYADLRIGAPVEVEFQTIAPGAVIPQFRVV